MCSFIFARTQKPVSESTLAGANAFAQRRGPDRTSTRRLIDNAGQHLVFLHNLLDISGHSSAQPFCSSEADSELVGLFNGEVYNFRAFGEFRSDTESLAPAYRKYGIDLARHLDGEFAIVVFDGKHQTVNVYSDPFLTKPIYLGRNEGTGEIGVATCASSLSSLGFESVRMAEPNCAYRIHLTSDSAYVEEFPRVVEFKTRQYKNSLANWTHAFLDAVRKRACHGAHRPIVFLSSGYDSGAICLALNLQGIEYDTMTITAGEHSDVLSHRIKVNRAASCGIAYQVSGLRPSELERLKADIEENVEPFAYMHEDAPGQVSTLQTDGGALGASFLAEYARKEMKLVNLSGAGADEILSDYGYGGKKFYHHSEFGGLFPEQLDTIFPWKKFYGDTQRSYLFKDEFILGRHGIEGRYPFLDKGLVQEFLSLSVDVKNRTYKSPLENFLAENSYPFERMAKRGFSPRKPETFLTRFLSQFRK